jgi:hypothetical protein
VKKMTRSNVDFSTSTNLDAWVCTNCEDHSEFVILGIMRGRTDDGVHYAQTSNWGNPIYKPYCPYCGSNVKVSRELCQCETCVARRNS